MSLLAQIGLNVIGGTLMFAVIAFILLVIAVIKGQY